MFIVVLSAWLSRYAGGVNFVRVLTLLVAVASCLSAVACGPGAPVPAATILAPLRGDLATGWIDGAIRWPPNDGCATPPVVETLEVGRRLDRFGPETGALFSPEGEPFRARSIPYICNQIDYRVYRVVMPIEVRTCRAAPWFGEPGGATTVKTSMSAADLVARGALATLSSIPAGTGGSQCDPG